MEKCSILERKASSLTSYCTKRVAPTSQKSLASFVFVTLQETLGAIGQGELEGVDLRRDVTCRRIDVLHLSIVLQFRE